eukprot:TRINITY_DN2044_c0_g1_i1.p1 TRINITY_DN2044_c0_g1~~TRINITY_DN2044_c0_g1_i1.p1  ORF type:complete len:642 (-),score=103.45 TRINITY_DN2044_c0_g1_i1:995-2920(-)
MSSSSGDDALSPLENNTNVKSPSSTKRSASPGKTRWRNSSGSHTVKTTGTKSKRSSLSFGKQDALEALRELEDGNAPPLDSQRSSSEATWREKNGKVVIVKAQIPFLIRSLLADNSDQNYLEYFLATFDYFLDTIDLLQMLIDMYHAPPDIGTASADDLDALGSKVIIQLRIINVLKKVGDLKYNAYKDDQKWLSIFQKFVGVLEKGTEIERSCALRLQIFASSKSNISSFVTPFPKFNAEKGKDFDFLMADPKVIAKQLCLLDLKMIKAIPAEELHHKHFEEKSSNITKAKTNIAKAVDNFNETSYWLASYFFVTDNPKDRLQILCKYIQIMDYCLHYNNYNSVMKIFSALNMTPVSSLANYWSELPPEFIAIWERIQQVMNHGHNYKIYREMLEKAKPPCLPYLGLILRDLIYIEELDTKIGDMVNWEKMNLLGKTFSTFTKFQKQIFTFDEDPVILNFFADISGSKGVLFDEAVLYEISKEAKTDVVKSAPSTLQLTSGPNSGRGRLNSSSDSSPGSPNIRDRRGGSFSRSTPHYDLSETGSEISDSEISSTETNDYSMDWEDETSFSSLMGANHSSASMSISNASGSRSEKSRTDQTYHLPFWVKKREVTTIDGQKVLLEDIFDKSTVIFVLLRQFG